MKSVTIIGATISGNRGAEAMACTVIARIREKHPDVLFNLFSYYPDSDKQLVSAPWVRIYSAEPLFLVFKLFPTAMLGWFFRKLRLKWFLSKLPSATRELEKSTLLLDISGVSFMDGRVKFLPFNILAIWPAILLGVPVVKLSQAIGPFTSFWVKLSSKIFLPRCKHIFARGVSTRHNLDQLKLNNISSAADTAFCHMNGDSLSSENDLYLEGLEIKLENWQKEKRKIVGLCPSSVVASKARKNGENYPLKLYRLVELLVNAGFSVLIFPNATRQSSLKLRNNDIPVIEEIARYFTIFNPNSNSVCCAVRDINTDAIKRLIRFCDVTAVSRFHAMIASLSLEVPPVVVGWSHKYLEVMESFGLESYVFDYSKSDVNLLIQTIEKAYEERKNHSETIRACLPRVKSSSYKQFEYVLDILES